jgi:capsid assembly protease
MQNIFLNQPLAVDKNYLLSLIPNLLMGYRKQDFLSAEHILQQVENNLQSQKFMQEPNEALPAMINIIGPIVKYSSWYYMGTQSLIQILNRLDAMDNVSGILLNIDSGGGMVSGTAELADCIASLSKKTIAYTNGYMCSAALDIAAATSARVANPHADCIGSIGTMLSYQDFSQLFEKYGATIYDIYAPQSSEKNSDFRALKADDKSLYEAKLASLADSFINRVKSNIGDGLQDDGHVFKGAVYSPQDAKAIGLIDEIGSLEFALEQLY